MTSIKGYLIGAFVGLLILVLVGVVLPGIGLGYLTFWGPKFRTAERNVFEQSKSFNHGMKDDLAKYYGEYMQAKDEDTKLAIKAVVRLRFTDFDAQSIHEPALKSFLFDARGY